MYGEVNKSVSLNDLIGVVSRRKSLLLLTVLAAVIPVLIYNYKTVPVYRASTKVIFEDSEKVMDFNFSRSLNRDNFLTNQIEEMKTKSFAEEVFFELPHAARDRFFLLPAYAPEFDSTDFIVNQIMDHLSLAPIRETEIIDIMFDSEHRGLTQIVANAAASVLIKRNLMTRRQQYSNVRKFIDQQFEIVKTRLEEAENALKDFKERQRITSIEDESREILQRVTQAEIVFNEVKTSKKELQQRLAAIEGRLDTEKKDLTKNIIKTTSPLAARLKEQLVELEVLYSNLQVQGFPKNNPKMIDLEKEIGRVKSSLVSETIKISKEANMQSLMDPFSQIKKYLEESISLDVELRGLEAKERNLGVLLSDYSNALRRLPAKELRLVRLMRDKEVNSKLYMSLLEEREAARIKEASEIGNIRILEPARLPAAPILPRKTLNIFVGIFSGIFLGVLVIFSMEYLNDEVRTQDDVERDLGFPVIAVIPKSRKELDGLFDLCKHGRLLTTSTYDSLLFDSYNLLSFALEKRQTKSSTIMLTSSVPNEGKSTISTMLAITSAQRGKRTLLIDADLRKPTLNTFFRVPREPGLTNLVIEIMQMQRRHAAFGGNGNARVVVPSPPPGTHLGIANDQMINTFLIEGLIQTFEKNLLFLPSGFIPANPVRIWSSTIWTKIFLQLSEIVDVIIIDAPPIIGVAETTMMAAHVEHILLCVAAGTVDKKTLKRSITRFHDTIPNSKEKILGVVLNKAELSNIYGRYKSYKYYAKKDRSTRTPETPRLDFTS